MRKALKEHLLPDEAGAAGEDDFHGFDGVREIDVG